MILKVVVSNIIDFKCLVGYSKILHNVTFLRVCQREYQEFWACYGPKKLNRPVKYDKST